MLEFSTVNHRGTELPLRYLLRSDACSVICLHESAGIVEDYLRATGCIDGVVFVLTWSWYCDDKKAAEFAAYIDRLCAEFPAHAATIRNNIIFAMNSPDETRRFSEALPGVRVVTASNACFLSSELFRPTRRELGDIAVMNAKPLSFKRHRLTTLVEPKVFIAYDEVTARKENGYCDIRQFGAQEIYWDIPAWRVNEINGLAFCGLALSAVEGACYASTEYLLSGLPVVSTRSRGGRHVYFNAINSLVVEPTPEAVARGVSTVFARRGEFDRWAIHKRASARSREFRRALAAALATATSGAAGDFEALLEETVRQDSKLLQYRNFWSRSLRRVEQPHRDPAAPPPCAPEVGFTFRGKRIDAASYGRDYIAEFETIFERLEMRPKTILEWGSGLSSLILLEKSKDWESCLFVSIDNDKAYQDAVFADRALPPFFQMVCLDLTGPCRNQRDPELNYSTYPLSLGTSFDLIYIDGRRRLECGYVAALLSHADTRVVMHDYRRARYQPILALFEVVEDGPQFRILRLRREFLAGLPAARKRIAEAARPGPIAVPGPLLKSVSNEALGYRLQCAFVSRRPNVLLLGMDTGGTGYRRFRDGTSTLSLLCEFLGRRGHLLINPWWVIDHSQQWLERLQHVRELLAAYPEVKVTFFCNSPRELPIVKHHALDAVLLPHNVFANERVFRIIAGEKEFDAVYQASMKPFKRHYLANEIESLALIYSRHGYFADYFPRVQSELRHAVFLNGDPNAGSYRQFTPAEVARRLNRARVGLCLSAEEGGNYASIEYMLCGLPVVSTVSEGGRELFFDDEFCTLVQPDAAAVRQAVADLVRRNIDPQLIRAAALQRIRPYRKQFIEYVNAIKAVDGSEPDAERDLERIMSGPWSCWSYESLEAIRAHYSHP